MCCKYRDSHLFFAFTWCGGPTSQIRENVLCVAKNFVIIRWFKYAEAAFNI